MAIEGPWLWLVYLPLFFLGWLGRWPTGPQIAGAAAGLALFLAAYGYGWRQTGRRAIVAAWAILLTGCALASSGGLWTVIAIYAASIMGRLRPTRSAVAGVVALIVAALIFALVTRQPWATWAYGLLLMLVVGVSNAMSTLVRDKNQAIYAAAVEVRAASTSAERERLARDLHDVLGRTLTLIAVKADLAQRLVAHDPGQAKGEITDIAAAARSGLGEVRQALLGLGGATLAQEIEASRQALASAGVGLTANVRTDALAPQDSAVLAMVLREAVTNVIRHAEARHCRVELARANGWIELMVRDDGIGHGGGEGHGLAGMRARMEAAGGTFAIGPAAPGTLVRAGLREVAA